MELLLIVWESDVHVNNHMGNEKTQQLIEIIASLLVFIFANFAALFVMLSIIVQPKDWKNDIASVLCLTLIYIMSTLALCCYRVVQINELIKVKSILGSKSFPISDINETSSIYRFAYLLKLRTASILLWNHLGGAEYLSQTIEKRKNEY